MSHANLLGLYRPGNTIIHRATPGFKLIVLLILSIAIVAVRTAWFSVSMLAVILFMAAFAQISWLQLYRSIRMLLILLALTAVFHIWQNGIERAVAVVIGILTLILASAVLTATTDSNHLIDGIVRWLGPFRRFGVNPEAVGLAFSLLLRFIPDMAQSAIETRDAARARGLERNPRALLTPLTLRAVAQARMIGEALHARGVADDLNK